MMSKPSCKVCRDFRKLRNQKPDCKKCLPELYEENETSINIWQITRNQTGFGGDIDFMAIVEAMRLFEVEKSERKQVLQDVLSVHGHVSQLPKNTAQPDNAPVKGQKNGKR